MLEPEEFEEFLASLGGEVGGHLEGTRWHCVCGDTGTETSERRAAMALFFHRRSGHREITVETS